MRALITLALIAAIGVFGFTYFGDMNTPKQTPNDPSDQTNFTRQATPERPLTLVEKLSQLHALTEDENWTESAGLIDDILNNGFEGSPLQNADIKDLKVEFAQIYYQAKRPRDAITLMETVRDDDNAIITRIYERADNGLSLEDRQKNSFVRANRADRLQMLGDWYLENNEPEKAFDAYQLSKSDRAGLVPEFSSFPEQRYLVDQSIKAARAAKMDYSTFCYLEMQYRQVDHERAAREPLEYWGDATGMVCPAAGQTYSVPSGPPNFETVKIFYGTSRAHTGKTNVEKTFGSKRAGLSTGYIDMTVPLDREIGTIQIPGLFAFSGARDGVHIVLTRINPSNSTTQFREELGKWVEENPAEKKEAFIYVHGHAVAFSNAARRAAQLAVDLDMRHGGMFYSWPTGGNALQYFKSQANVDHGAEELRKFLLEVTALNNIDELHIIAHSMGNDVLSKALGKIELEGYTAEQRPFGQIIWASPDVDATDFSRRIEAFKSRQLADGMTLYASSKDKALSVSKWIWDNFPRAGQAPPVPEVASIIETVDTSDIDRNPSDLLAHGDYASAAIDDMRAVIWLSLGPGRRCSLTKKTVDGIDYWTAARSTATCDKPTFRSAVTIARSRLYPQPEFDPETGIAIESQAMPPPMIMSVEAARLADQLLGPVE